MIENNNIFLVYIFLNMQKQMRPWVYALMYKDDQILVVKKWRWPFTGMYDLPWGKIEHYEKHIDWLKREIFEETGLMENEFEIKKLLTVEETFATHVWQKNERQDHIIWIVYLVQIITQKIHFDHKDDYWDARGSKLIDMDDENIQKTHILQQAILKFRKGKDL